VLFLEREQDWYAAHRDLPKPDFCKLSFYRDLRGLEGFRSVIASADAVMVGSYVPDGIAVSRFVQETARGIIAFYDIDTPVTLAQLDAGTCGYLSADRIPHFDLYLSFSGGPVLDRLTERYGARAARPLYCAVDQEAYRPWPGMPEYDVGYLGTYAPDRQRSLEDLLIAPARQLPDRRFAVAGPQYPTDIEWPSNVTRIEHVAPADHAAFYGSCRYALNVTRQDMVRAGFSPSVRLFEAAACGTPIISDRWPGLETLLVPGHEILTAGTSDEVVALIEQTTEPERRAIGERARARVLAGHTAEHRARELAIHLAEARRAAALPAFA
jgi:spore maturation protein CgeB